jgi:hypothetical protein
VRVLAAVEAKACSPRRGGSAPRAPRPARAPGSGGPERRRPDPATAQSGSVSDGDRGLRPESQVAQRIMSLAISYWLRRRDQGKAESAADAHSNMDAYFPHASLGSLSQRNLICASWSMAAERSQSTHNGGSSAQGADER